MTLFPHRLSRLSRALGEVRSAQALYKRFKEPAQGLKVALQMLTGLAAMVIMIISLVRDLAGTPHPQLIESHVLAIVAAALAVAASLELSYTLFTDGPDEAIDPLLLGLSAGLLYLVSTLKTLTWTAGLALVLFAGTLALLFAVRRRFISNEDVRESQADRRDWRAAKVTAVMGNEEAAEAALDLLELLEFAWHDCHGDTPPPRNVIDDILTQPPGDLAGMVRLARRKLDGAAAAAQDGRPVAAEAGQGA